MKYDTYISLGFNCFIAQALVELNIRQESLPFDWLLTSYEYGLHYITDMINTNFSHFTSNLAYNKNHKVCAERYPKSEFYHHDLIANEIYKNKLEEKQNNTNLIETFNRRAKRFMDIIHSDKKVLLMFYIEDIDRIYTGDKINIFNASLKEFCDLLNTINQNRPSKIDFIIIIKKIQQNRDITTYLDFNNVNIGYVDTTLSDIIKKYL